ncbi:MAG: transcription factor RcaD, partial [Rivularia sp. ALOHA_DT_140]|nr:transcription factor RcaD [Rivularia sp. ALOHA_DT_140]
SLSRDTVDKILFKLQADDKIELSTLQEASAYTPEQIESGIEQNVGGPLFFISVY